MIYVDELRPVHKRVGRFPSGTEWCHLTTNGPLNELHQFAAKIGMKRAWFQDKRVPHYDLVSFRREAALREGATFMGAREQVVKGIGRKSVSSNNQRCAPSNNEDQDKNR